MKAINLRHLTIGLAMLIAAGLAFGLTPRDKLAEHGPKVDLETMIPKQFGEWRVDDRVVPIQAAPDVQAKLDAIYNQTLARTYVNPRDQRVMLSIAYGGDQSNDRMQVHRPEYCYHAQGFEVQNAGEGILQLADRSIPIRRLLATQGNRKEPISYWITIGDKATLPGFQRKLAQLAYGLTGKVPDGLLYRVSTITQNVRQGYALQNQFSRELIEAVRPAMRQKLVGSGNS
jgi:EpsI family protein